MYSLKNLKRRKARTTLTFIGITLAMIFSTTMLSFSEGMDKSVAKLVEKSGVDIFVFGENGNLYYQPEFVNSREIAQSIVDNNSKVRDAMPELKSIVYCGKQGAKPNSIRAFGIIPAMAGEIGGEIKIIKGQHMPTKKDTFYGNGTYNGSFTHEVLVNKYLADSLDLEVGDQIYLNPHQPESNQTHLWLENSTYFTVFGVMEAPWETPEPTCHLHLAELQWMLNKTHDEATAIFVDLYHPRRGEAEQVAGWIEKNYNLSASTKEEFVASIERFTTIFSGFSDMITLVTVGIALLFISTVIMISTRERTAEIGALRAIGISRKTIFCTVMFEALFICLISGIIGLAIGYPCTHLFNEFMHQMNPHVPSSFRFTLFTYPLMVNVLCASIGLGMLSGLLPALLATKTNIVKSLRAE